MATPIQLLQLSPTMSDGTIVKWLVKEGDKISAGDILAEIETDKAVMEQEAFEDGIVLKLLAKEGDSVPVGSNIAVVGEAGEDASDFASGGAAEAKKAEPKKEEKKEEQKAEKPAEEKKESKPAAKEEEKPAAASAPSSGGASSNGDGGGRVLVSPLARKMAAEHGVDLGAVKGSGPHGRIVKRDIETALEGGAPTKAKEAPATKKSAVTVAPDELEEVALSGMRKTIARRLVQSRQEIPSFSLTVEVNAQPLLDAVARLKQTHPDDKITVTHFVIKAMAGTLMRHEWLRTQWIDGKLLRQHAAHIPVAVAIEDGLLTPVIRNANGKGLVALAHELRELAAKARDRKLSEAELSGGTQTLSNLGMFGIDRFDAIINPPESSILAVGAVVEKPVVRDGAIVPGKTMSLTLSCDHRVVDGAVGAAYLKDLKAALEEPLLVLA